ncbi:MAG: hypothetical protein KC502_23820 [Myxococcales bacterium]|nr:hypothetical protein [Myxococcales bacterium]
MNPFVLLLPLQGPTKPSRRLMWRPLLHCLTMTLLAAVAIGCVSDDVSGGTRTIVVGGHAFAFSTGGGQLDGATVTILELPERQTQTSADGSWAFDGLQPNTPLTFVLSKDGWSTTQTGTLSLATDTHDVTFQVPDDALYKVLASMVGVTAGGDVCQIASTVTRRGHSLYDRHGTHGEPEATVVLVPTAGAKTKAIYFNLVKYNVIFPDQGLTETSHDGGVVFANVPPGDYTLRATKAGTTFRDVRITCRAGMLVNASPPWGLQVLTGGLNPKKPGEKGPFD